ncbi:adhesion G protein-coupled receptor E3-like [Orycteropus afer afer]|uniref:Adhesion G protein-coupled receptor E3-like n=1 Tax=Orycteropus afer afer TaxID=1230840 RepID=A0AC54Z7J1_ORYAF|nr:adhesion G protein-coupled receptor E3-like [Orycteropus afer afer]
MRSEEVSILLSKDLECVRAFEKLTLLFLFSLLGLFCFIFLLNVCSSSGQDDDGCKNSMACPSKSICNNIVGGYFCICKPGYVSSSGANQFTDPTVICTDINECLIPGSCPKHTKCRNTPGSYRCTKKQGFSSNSSQSEETNSNFSAWSKFLTVCKQQDQDRSKMICSAFTKLMPGFQHGNSTPPLKEIANSFEILTNMTSQLSVRSHIASAASLYLQIMQLLSYKSALKHPTEGTQRGEADLIAIETLTLKRDCEWKEETFELKVKGDSMDVGCTVITGGGTGGAVTFISYSSMGSIINGSFVSKENLITGEELGNFHVNSKVVSGAVGYKENVLLATPVNFTFQHLQMIGERKKPLCVYWRETGWSDEGCQAIFSNRTQTVCSCSHLSTFAVLMASVVLTEDPVLVVVTRVGLSLSLLCLLLAALTFALCRPIQNTSTSLHLQLSLCLLLAHLLFLVGIDKTEPKVLCSVIAGALHYLYLASFTWMFLEGLHLFLTVRNLKVANYTSAGRFKKCFMYPFGYGIPAVIVAVSAGLNRHGYGTSLHCWINLQKEFIWSFIGPISVVILINLTFYLITLWILRERLSSLNKDVSKIQDTRMLTFKAVAQLFLLGCSWCLGFFLVKSIKEPFRSVIAYVFTITNVLQGVYIFLVHCLLNRQVQEEYKRCFAWMSKMKSESSTMATSSTYTQRPVSDQPRPRRKWEGEPDGRRGRQRLRETGGGSGKPAAAPGNRRRLREGGGGSGKAAAAAGNRRRRRKGYSPATGSQTALEQHTEDEKPQLPRKAEAAPLHSGPAGRIRY